MKTFGIDNAFTTTDQNYHREFVKIAKDILKTTPDGWKTVADSALELVHKKIEGVPRNQGFLVSKMIQVVVFGVVFRKFFPGTPQPLQRDARFITSKINSLWIGSKSGNVSRSKVHLKDKNDLHARLAEIFKLKNDGSLDSRTNPLNILLPVYETLWRVVLRCFVEVLDHSHPERADWLKKLRDFLSEPDKSTFQAREAGVSVHDLVAETLRLYPPTRRIYRQTGQIQYGVDVEFLHRNTDIWGLDAGKFNPRRWINVSDRQNEAYMPFGMGKFVCPAKWPVGPMMIGVIVAALAEHFGKEEFVLVQDRDDRNGVDKGREAYSTLKMVWKSV